MPEDVVLKLERVGPVAVFQTKPLALIIPPPFEEILPPEKALLFVIPETEVVVIVAKIAGVALKLSWELYPVPVALVA